MFIRVHRLSPLVILLLAQACTSTQQPVKQPPPRPLSQTESAVPQPFMLRGELSINPQGRSFTPCGSKHQFWPEFDPDTETAIAALEPNGDGILYAELAGVLAPTSTDGPDADFTARLNVHTVNQIKAAGVEICHTTLHTTQAYSSNPAWQAGLSKGELNYQIGKQPPQHHNLVQTRLSSEQRQYQLEQETLTLERGLCSDKPTRYLTGWQASLTQEKQTLRGCGHLSDMDSTTNWTGIYSASSKHNNGFSVELQLNPDHSATTLYYQAETQPTRSESGYWQQVNPDQIQVIMTRHQGQRLTANRLFTGNQYQLHTNEELVNDTLYQIKDGGLTLYRTNGSRQQNQTRQQHHLTAIQLNGSDNFAADVDQAIRHYFAIHRTPLNNTRYRWLKYDLNHDGRDELLAMMNWCDSTGCTLLVFEQQQGQWRFNSRVASMTAPLQLGTHSTYNWQDIIVNPEQTQGNKQQHRLSYSGVSYQNKHPLLENELLSGVVLFADGLSPKQAGVNITSGAKH